MRDNSVLQKLIHTGETVGKDIVEVGAPIAGAIVGGPAGAAAGAALSKKLKGTQNKKLPTFTPSSAGSLGEARAQDKARMSDQYGIEY